MRCPSAADRDRGSATAEFVVALPAAVLVLVVVVTALQLSALHVRVQSVASMAARSVARSESVASVAARVATELPGATMKHVSRGDLECVAVSVRAATVSIRIEASGCALAAGA